MSHLGDPRDGNTRRLRVNLEEAIREGRSGRAAIQGEVTPEIPPTDESQPVREFSFKAAVSQVEQQDPAASPALLRTSVSVCLCVHCAVVPGWVGCCVFTVCKWI